MQQQRRQARQQRPLSKGCCALVALQCSLLVLFASIQCGYAEKSTKPPPSTHHLQFDPTTISATTTEDTELVGRGDKKFGDKCEETRECGFRGSICEVNLKSCQCIPDLPVTNHINKCGKEVAVNGSCFFNEQCEATTTQTECRDERCVCKFEMSPILENGHIECRARNDPAPNTTYVDPAMIGVLVGMALMFVIICVVLRLFSNARWRENRTIFNTPNPRLMNVSLLRDSKLLHGDRRGSRGSMRAPSRQPSMASLRPHSPTSQGSRRGSRASSNASIRSNRSPTATTNPASGQLETSSVTIDVAAATTTSSGAVC